VFPKSGREPTILQHWQLGFTIDKISAMTGIPRSTVGYYVKKFRREYGSPNQKNTPKPAVERSKDERLNAEALKIKFMKMMPELVKKGGYREIVDCVDAYFAAKRLERELSLYRPGEKEITSMDFLGFLQKYSFFL